MRTYTQEVGPAAPWFAPMAGLRLLLTTAPDPVTVRFLREQRVIAETIDAQQGDKWTPAGGFDGFRIESATVQTLRIQVTDGDIDESRSPGAIADAIDARLRAAPLDVSNDRGSPGNLLFVSGVSIADAPAVAISNGAAVACGPVAVVVKAANANARALRFHNIGPDPVAIGAAGITWAARCIVLEAGDVWIEDRAANLAWSAITDAGDAANVTVQEIAA